MKHLSHFGYEGDWGRFVWENTPEKRNEIPVGDTKDDLVKLSKAVMGDYPSGSVFVKSKKELPNGDIEVTTEVHDPKEKGKILGIHKETKELGSLLIPRIADIYENIVNKLGAYSKLDKQGGERGTIHCYYYRNTETKEIEHFLMNYLPVRKLGILQIGRKKHYIVNEGGLRIGESDPFLEREATEEEVQIFKIELEELEKALKEERVRVRN